MQAIGEAIRTDELVSSWRCSGTLIDRAVVQIQPSYDRLGVFLLG
jgi:hypothetical protein